MREKRFFALRRLVFCRFMGYPAMNSKLSSGLTSISGKLKYAKIATAIAVAAIFCFLVILYFFMGSTPFF